MQRQVVDDAALIADRQAGMSLRELADKYNIHHRSVGRRLEKYKTEPLPSVQNVEIWTRSSKQENVVPMTVEEAISRWRKLVGLNGELPKPCAPREAKQNGEKKILLLNDIHAPYHSEEALAQAIAEQADDTDVLIIGGDLLDLYNVSRYDKYDMHFTLQEELRAGQALLAYLSSKFPKVRIIPGNHDERWRKWLVTRKGISPGDLAAINLLAQMGSQDTQLSISDPLYCMTRGLENVEVEPSKVRGFAKFDFFLQEGDLVVSHAEKFSRVTGQAANAAVQWFMSCARAMNPPLVGEFRVFAQTHTHQAGLHWGNFGIWTMECGCLAETPDYAANPKLMGAGRPSILGYSVFYQDAVGRTDMRRSRFIPIEG